MPYDWIESIKNSPVAKLNRHLFEVEKKVKKSKYNNQKLEIDGHLFDSKREARRYLELRIMLTAGIIQNLLLQQPYELNEGGSHSLKYLSDFEYDRDGEHIVEDVKGYKTKIYLKKKKLMKQIYNIEILES